MASTVLYVQYPLDSSAEGPDRERCLRTLQGYLAHMKTPSPLGPPLGL
jgi:hypothetical protein